MLSNRDDSLGSCAKGAYDSHFRALGATLNRHGRQGSYVRLGWEGNGEWYPWSGARDPAGWRACFRREAQALRAVAPQVQIDWSMNKDGAVAAADLYPGDDVVDVIGVDYYNTTPPVGTQQQWDREYTRTQYGDSPVGIGAWLAFAHAHGKLLSVPEWGVDNGDGTGDDPVYVQNMYDFFRAHGSAIAYEAYFNAQCPDFCVFPPGRNPRAAERYRQLWAAG
jgi:beta-mannanase